MVVDLGWAASRNTELAQRERIEMTGHDDGHTVDLSVLLEPNSREAFRLLLTGLERLVSALARFASTGIANDEALSALWELADDLFNVSSNLRENLAINDDHLGSLFRHWNDTTGMRIWRLLTAIHDAGDAVEEVAYWLTRTCEGPEDSEI